MDGEELQGYEAAESEVLGLVHHTHSATPKCLDEAVVGDDPTWHERGVWHGTLGMLLSMGNQRKERPDGTGRSREIDYKHGNVSLKSS
jgi:hypothetical protein